MAPSSSAVHIRLAEPVVFLRNLDSATDRRERRAQRRRAQQAADALLRAGDHASHHPQDSQAHHSGSLFRHPDQGYIPPSGRGGAGSRSRDRSGSQIRGSSSSRGGSNAQAGTSSPRLTPSLPPLPNNNGEEAPADPQRGRSPAPRRGDPAPAAAASPQEPMRTASPPQPPVLPTYVATPGIDHVAPPPPPLPLVDVPVIQPENSDIGLTRPPAIIRGVMTVHFSKPTRVKKIGIRLKGQSKTEWPEGLGPRRLDTAERNTLIDETVYFFDATSSSASQSRRTASIGPGTVIANRDSFITPEAFERGTRAMLASSASRSASMMPATRPYQGPASTSESTPRAPPGVGGQTVTTPEEAPRITGAPLTDSPPAAEPPQYSPITEHQSTTTGAVATVASARRSPTPDSPRLPHEHFQDRAAELRAEAAAMSPSSTPLPELSPAPSRASSLYGRTTTTTTAVHGGSTENSRPGSVASTEHFDSSLPSSSGLSGPSETSTVGTPSSTEVPLTPLETSASRMSLSSASDVEAASSMDDQRGRSQVPVNRGARGSQVLTNQTIMEDGPQEAYLDSLDERHEHGVSSPPSSSRLPLAVQPAQAVTAATYRGPTSSLYDSQVSFDSQNSSATPASSSSITLGSNLPASARRSSSAASSHTLNSHTPKSTRFSLSSLIHRDKSSSRTRRSVSPESMQNSRRNHSTSRTRGAGLQAIKNALIGHHDKDSQMVTTHVTQTPLSSEAESESEDDHNGRGRSRSASRSSKWQEFKAGSYNFPIYFPIPLSLPPTIHANHGQVTYMLKGFVNRAGALTTNLHAVSEVHVVAAPHEDDLEAIESIIVERMWETQLNYKIVIHCKSVPVGGQIPVTIRLNPLSKMKVFRLTAILEEKFTIYAKDRKLARSEPIRRYDLIKIQNPDNSAMLPIISDDPDAIGHSPLKDWIHGYTTTDGEGIQTMDPNGPWILENNITVPDCSSALQFSTSHEKANISVIHSLKIIMRVERGDDDYLDSKGDRKKFDIIVEAPMHILSCRTAAVNALPTYTTNPSPITNPFDAHGEISIDSSAFHPHELSDNERHALHYRAGGHLSVVPHRSGHNQRHSLHSMSAAATGVSDSQLQAALLQGSGASASGDPPPPTYEYVATHPDEGTSPPILAITV